MKIGICNDHAGVEYKNQLAEYLKGKGYEIVNFGTDTTASMDYPDVAHPLAEAVESGKVDLGIAFCGTGNGITASGLPVAPGMVAVDPDVIPLGSTVIINGVEYLAADTGVNGQHIDIAVPTHSQADELGTYAADVWVVRK